MNSRNYSSLSERVQLLLAESIQVPPDIVTPDLAFGDLLTRYTLQGSKST